MTTEKQKTAIKFCEDILVVKFRGDVSDFQEVSDFLSEYLEKAKTAFLDIMHSYDPIYD